MGGRTNLGGMPPLRPTTRFSLNLLQLLAALLFVGGAGYSVGVVRADLQHHVAGPGHVQTSAALEKVQEKVQVNTEILAKVSAVLEVLKDMEKAERSQ